MTQVVERITTRDLTERIYPVRNADLGALARAINQLADKLQSQMKKRAREKDRLTTVMHVMTDGVIILNRNGVVKLINNAAARMLNTTGEKAMHRTFVQTVRDHRIAEVWKRCQASGEEEVAAIELGVTQFMRVAVTPFLGRAGRGYLVMLQDLTQVRRLQTVRQDFISNVSHELRTPLASLRALAETLRDSALDDPPAAARFLDRMEIEVDALTQMVEELLELSRIESGQVPLRLNPVMPYAAISPAVDRLRAQAERGQLTLELNVSRDLPLVLVDAGRIHQVVTNIVHNAIKFTPPEGNITVSANADATKVTVAVTDTGIGIAPNDLTRIFERFYKTDRSRAVGGTGLGLAIAKHIVQAHGGAIWATSQEGKGSIFFFTMPRAEPEAQIEPAAGEIKGEVNPSMATSIPTNVPMKSVGSSTRYA
jgi:two-component system phosphate regulon sensor histidine kinase PhoR